MKKLPYSRVMRISITQIAKGFKLIKGAGPRWEESLPQAGDLLHF
jgi:hypothetical protein